MAQLVFNLAIVLAEGIWAYEVIHRHPHGFWAWEPVVAGVALVVFLAVTFRTGARRLDALVRESAGPAERRRPVPACRRQASE